MCKGHIARLASLRFGVLAVSILLLLLSANDLSAQGGGGRSETAEKPVPGSKNLLRRPPKRIYRASLKRPPIILAPAPVEGTITLLVNEGGSEIHLSSVNAAESSGQIITAPNAPSLIARTLPAGNYSLLVKKPGFFDEARSVTITPGKRRKVIVNLRPKLAILSVNTNIADAQIEIEKIGQFNRPLRKYRIKPGTYNINVQRRGFISQTIPVDLKIPGQEQNITVVLQPLRIDSVLDQAYDKISHGDYSAAADLTNDVLLLNSAHARANFLFGLVEFYRSDPSSVSYLLKAIRNGETVKLPVKFLDEVGSIRLVDAELGLSRERFSFRTSGRVEPNIIISWPDISELERSADQTYIVLKGKGDSYGHPIEERLMLYSPIASLRPNLRESFCQSPAAVRSCTSDIDILFRLLSGWRASFHKSTVAK
jgi:PEGA domain-containing protein